MEMTLWPPARAKRNQYEIKAEMLGPDAPDKPPVEVLNRTLAWTDEGVEHAAGPRHAELIVEEFGLGQAKGVCSPAARNEGLAEDGHEDLLPGAQAKKCSSSAARSNHSVTDRADIARSVNQLAGTMGKPTKGCWDRPKGLGRYLAAHPRVVVSCRWQRTPSNPKIYTDADRAGCKRTPGGCITFDSHSAKIWSKTQALAALSRGGGGEFLWCLGGSRGRIRDDPHIGGFWYCGWRAGICRCICGVGGN